MVSGELALQVVVIWNALEGVDTTQARSNDCRILQVDSQNQCSFLGSWCGSCGRNKAKRKWRKHFEDRKSLPARAKQGNPRALKMKLHDSQAWFCQAYMHPSNPEFDPGEEMLRGPFLAMTPSRSFEKLTIGRSCEQTKKRFDPTWGD